MMALKNDIPRGRKSVSGFSPSSHSLCFFAVAFGFGRTAEHVVSQFANQGLILCPTVKEQSLAHWTAREVPHSLLFHPLSSPALLPAELM